MSMQGILSVWNYPKIIHHIGTHITIYGVEFIKDSIFAYKFVYDLAFI